MVGVMNDSATQIANRPGPSWVQRWMQRRRIKSAFSKVTAVSSPFPHVFVRNVLSPSEVQRVLDNWPVVRNLRDEPGGRHRQWAFLIEDQSNKSHLLASKEEGFWPSFVETTVKPTTGARIEARLYSACPGLTPKKIISMPWSIRRKQSRVRISNSSQAPCWRF